MTDNSKYIGITFLLYIGSPILIAAFASVLIGPDGFLIFMTFGIPVALFSWFIFLLTKILPATNGKDGVSFCILLYTSFIFLIPAMILSYNIVSNNISDVRYSNHNRMTSSSRDAWDNNPRSQTIYSANSENINIIKEVLSDNLSNSSIQNTLKNTKLDNNETNNTFDFGFSIISNEEIRSRFNEIHEHVKQRSALHNQLAKWINEQAQQRRIFIPYPEIYHKTKEFIDLNI